MQVKLNQIYPNLVEVRFWIKASLYYSYETIVAFERLGKRYVSENIRSRTAWKHLNMISDKSERIEHEKFASLLMKVEDNISILSTKNID